MATSTLTQFLKECPNCEGKPFREIPNSGESFFFGLIGTPNRGIICARCRGAGKIKPKEIVFATDRIEPIKITY